MTATDCYQPVERELKLTRGLSKVMQCHQHPFSLVTKSSGVERDMARIHDMRGVKDYDSDFATRMKGSGMWAELIRQLLKKRVAVSALTASVGSSTSAVFSRTRSRAAKPFLRLSRKAKPSSG